MSFDRPRPYAPPPGKTFANAELAVMLLYDVAWSLGRKILYRAVLARFLDVVSELIA